MRTKKKTSLVVKIIAVVLVLASAAMLLLPWMSAKLNVMGQSFDLSGLLDFAAKMSGTTGEAMKQELMQSIGEGVGELQRELNVSINAGEITNFFEVILKGKWSPLDLLSMLGSVKKVVPPLLTALNAMPGGMMNPAVTASLQEASSGISTAYIILLVLVLLTAVMAVVAIVCAITDHKLGMIPFMVFALILLALFIYMVVGANKNSATATNMISSAADLPIDMGVKMELGIGSILCAVFAVLAFVVMCLPFGKKAVAAPAGVRMAGPAAPMSAPAAGWRCPGCGTMLRNDQKFCLNCGSKKPEAASYVPTPYVARTAPAAGWTCPGCGAKLRADQKFCPSCGSKQPVTSAPAPAQPAGWTCPGCGARLRADQKFCPSCGSKQPVTSAPAQPAGWTCPGCGARLRADQKFCPSCGSRQPAASVPTPAAAPELRRCKSCGATMIEGLRFCPTCGAREEDAPAPEKKPEPERPAITLSAPEDIPSAPAQEKTPAVSFRAADDDDL